MATALITGATGGLGSAAAEEFACRGVNLALTARDAKKLEHLAGQLRSKYGVQVCWVAADLADAHAPGHIYAALQQKGVQVDILVNNAGFGSFGEFAGADIARQQQMISVNVSAVMALTGLYVPEMARRGSGKILNVGSTGSFSPGPYISVYYATKAFVLSFSQALHQELRHKGVTVTALCPGPTKTGFEQAAGASAPTGMTERLPGLSPRQVMQRGIKALYAGKAVTVPGFVNKMLVLSCRLLPGFVVRKIVARVQLAARGNMQK